MARFSIKTALSEDNVDGNAIVCIDFGTALCKAAVSSQAEGGESILPLELGSLADDPRQDYQYFCQSSLYVSEDCRVFFGHMAQERWEVELNSGISGKSKIESIKDWFTSDPIAEFELKALGAEFVPSGHSLSKRHAVILLLAYVSRLVSKGLEKQKINIYAKRRFSRPVLQNDRGLWVDKVMHQCLGTAQIVADSIGGHWAQDGLLLHDLVAVIDAASNLKIPDHFVERKAVLEPVAAGFLAVGSNDEGQRAGSIVIDVGAGTTDIAAFLSRESNQRKPAGAAEPVGEPQSIPFAGNYIDTVLLEYVKKEVGALWQKNKQYRIEAQGKVRDWKELLFNTRQVEPTFFDGKTLRPIDLAVFVANEKIARFPREIRKALESVFLPKSMSGTSAIHHVLFGLPPLESLNVVFAGGGAKLPMLASVVRNPLVVDRQSVPLTIRRLTPSKLFMHFEKYSGRYPQLAVAIGGASVKYPWGSEPKSKSLGAPKQMI